MISELLGFSSAVVQLKVSDGNDLVAKVYHCYSS